MWYKILDFNNVVVDGPVDLEGSSSSSTAQRLRAWLPRFARRLEHRRPGRGDGFGDGAAPTIESPEIRHMKEVL
jgi:hypothetical protein